MKGNLNERLRDLLRLASEPSGKELEQAQVRALTEALDWVESQLEKAQVKAAAAQIVAETQAEELERQDREHAEESTKLHSSLEAALRVNATQAEDLERLRATLNAIALLLGVEDSETGWAKIREMKGRLTKQAAVIKAAKKHIDEHPWHKSPTCEALSAALDALTTETRDKPIHIEANPYMAVEHTETGEREP
jgi:hypothetical protein